VPTSLPIAETPGVDLRMMAAAVLTTVATAVAFALLPALRTGRHADADALRDGARAGVSRRMERVRSVLVVAEVTASVVLLVCSALLVQALLAVQQTDPGFRAEGVLTLRTALPTTKYAETARREQFYNAVLSEVRALPGVTHAAYTSFVPMVMRGGVWTVTVDGKPQDIGVKDSALLRQVTPGYFSAMGIPLLRGRDVADSDTAGTQLVAVVSEGFVRQHWPGLDPIGRRLFVAFNERVVVGVVGDVRIRGLEGRTEPQVYIPSAQIPDNAIVFYAPKDLVVRSSVPPSSLVPAIRDIISRADPQQPVSDVQTMQEIVERETVARRVQVLVIGAFAAIAVLLAGVGLHGVLAFSVSSRARDIGVRIALGAGRREILQMVLRQAFVLAAVGILLGGALSWAAGRSMQALLAGVSPVNGLAFGLTGLLVLVMTSAGSLLPALRAVRIDPIAVIRSE
jgi:putative ABC transport system permease protein